jgi:hypothetical protein
MKTLHTHFTLNRKQIPLRWPGKNRTHAAMFLFTVLIILYGCGKPSDNPTPPIVSPTGCVLASDVDETLGLRNFEYDDKGLLTKVTAPNYFYGTWVRTITPIKVNDVFTGYNAVYDYSGGSGNIYDGDPEFIHELSVADSLSQFKYDAKKRLVSILVPTPANGYYKDTFFTIFRYELNFTYDDNDNVTQVKIVKDYQEKINVPGSGESRIDYMQITDEELSITYDDKPSPYIAISKYWKFIGGDFLHFKIYSLNMLRFWAYYSGVLSKNNPVTMTGKLITSSPVPGNVSGTLTYQYNEKRLPVNQALNGSSINSFTYSCK